MRAWHGQSGGKETAEEISKNELIAYCAEKTKDWGDLEGWKLYRFLLETAKSYRWDASGYGSPEYQKDQAIAKTKNEEQINGR